MIHLSPSSRRAWVEIDLEPWKCYIRYVALLAEGVGRNMVALAQYKKELAVALLAEGVGRNYDGNEKPYNDYRRPPRGGRG